jgi:hypothetical protein
MEIQSENNKKTCQDPELKSIKILGGDYPSNVEVSNYYALTS